MYRSGNARRSNSSAPNGPVTANARISSALAPLNALSVTNLQQFQSLFAKALFAAILSMLSGMSCPGVTPVTSK
jgi:hypothetical protein